MLSLFFQNPIEQYPGVENAWWVAAIVATILLVLLLLLLGTGGRPEGWPKKWTDPLSVLVFFAFLGWTGILASLWLDSFLAVLLWALPSSAAIALTPRLLLAFQRKKMRRKGLKPEALVRSVGEVRQRIPPAPDWPGAGTPEFARSSLRLGSRHRRRSSGNGDIRSGSRRN